MLVVDASFALAWFFEDEATPRTSTVFEHSADDGIIVPAIWHYEMINSFRSAVLRRRISENYARASLMHLLRLTIDTDQCSDERMKTTYDLSCDHGLSVYDAAYLELARNRGLSLATNDKALVKAGERLGIVVV